MNILIKELWLLFSSWEIVPLASFNRTVLHSLLLLLMVFSLHIWVASLWFQGSNGRVQLFLACSSSLFSLRLSWLESIFYSYFLFEVLDKKCKSVSKF